MGGGKTIGFGLGHFQGGKHKELHERPFGFDFKKEARATENDSAM
jgi:hypothetical protein